MRLKFTLSHTPEIPTLADFATRSTTTSKPNWTTGEQPTVTIPSDSGNVGDVIDSEYIFLSYPFEAGQDYTLTFNYTKVLNAGVATNPQFIRIDILDDSFAAQFTQTDSSTSPGSDSISITFTATEVCSKVGLYVRDNSNVGYTLTGFHITGPPSLYGSSIEISEPDGWKTSVLKLERHESFHSLLEYFEGDANGAMIFYGDDGEINGGVDYIKSIEQEYGVNAKIEILIEIDPNDTGDYETVFNGLLKLSTIVELPKHKIQCGIIPNNFWAKFMNRIDNPVNIMDSVSLDRKSVEVFQPINLNLPPQKMQLRYAATSVSSGSTSEDFSVIDSGTYYQMSFNIQEFDEVKEVNKNMPQVTNPIQPAPWYTAEYEGSHTFEIQTVAHDYQPAFNFISDDISDYIQFYININGVETPFTVGSLFTSINIDGGRIYTLNHTVYLEAGDDVYIYGKAIADLTTGGGGYTGEIRWNGLVVGATVGLSTTDIECYARITAQTIYPETNADAFLVHDVGYQICERLGLGDGPFKSDYLGGTKTQTRVYDADGCGWMYGLVRGIHLRGYTLTEDEDDPVQRYTLYQKPFTMSFKEWWDGISPILCLGLSDYNLSASPNSKMIEVERIDEFFNPEISINFSYVHGITRTYSQKHLFRKVSIGYKDWQSEERLGNDDPQTKHVYSLTAFELEGTDISIESSFIAASLAAENCRRTKKLQSADYKHDNKTFIIALNEDDVSPDRFEPEINENFTSITNLLNSDTRYNSILTPKRNLLRWAKYLGGCLQQSPNSAYKFVSGEGNFDMVSQYNCSAGNECQAIICDELSESQDINLGQYNDTFGYLHQPIEYSFSIPMKWNEYVQIRNNRKNAIGISQTDSGHQPFFIKELTYHIVEGKADITAWPKDYFNIEVIDTQVVKPICDVDRITEDNENRVTENTVRRQIETGT
jgi:hypothetical protein